MKTKMSLHVEDPDDELIVRVKNSHTSYIDSAFYTKTMGELNADKGVVKSYPV